jgi:hypothetical protein
VEVRRRCPDLPDLGGCLLLGKHYAASNVLYLGINPGLSPFTHLDVELQQYNFLLEGPNDAKHSYFNNARKFFAASATLRAFFERATFGFCCPYRTENWTALPEHERDILIALSKSILRKMIADCRPALIVAAGRAGFDTVCEMLKPEWYLTKVLSCGGTGGTYQWSANRGSFNDQEIVIVQLPHFSRANSPSQLAECATWLTGVVASIGLGV